MNGLNNFDKTGRKYSLAPIDDLIRLWKSKVKVTAGRDEGIRVDAGASKYISSCMFATCVYFLIFSFFLEP